MFIDAFRYFYRRLNEFIDGESPVRTIFINGDKGKFHLKHGVSIHLVVSDAPNGDAREFLPVDTNHYLNAYDAVRGLISVDSIDQISIS